MFLYLNNRTNTLKACANGVTKVHVQKLWKKNPRVYWMKRIFAPRRNTEVTAFANINMGSS